MYYVYILISKKSNIYYVGMAKDVDRRVKEHNSRKSKFTKGHTPWTLVYKEGPYSTKLARALEKKYKKKENRLRLNLES